MISISLASGRPVASGPETELPAFRALVLERTAAFAKVPVDGELVATPGLPVVAGTCSSCGAREHISKFRSGNCSVCIVARFLAVDGMGSEQLRERAAARTRELFVPTETVAEPDESTSIPSANEALPPVLALEEITTPLPPAPPAPPATARPLATAKGRKTKPQRVAGSLF